MRCLYFTVWVFGDDARRVADKTSRQLQRQLAALRFRQQACRNRPRMVCNSSSEIVPLTPSKRRPFAVPGS